MSWTVQRIWKKGTLEVIRSKSVLKYIIQKEIRRNVNGILDNSLQTLTISMLICKNKKKDTVGIGEYYVKPLQILNEYGVFLSFGSILRCQQSSFAMPVRLKIRYDPNPKWILTPSAAMSV